MLIPGRGMGLWGAGSAESEHTASIPLAGVFKLSDWKQRWIPVSQASDICLCPEL